MSIAALLLLVAAILTTIGAFWDSLKGINLFYLGIAFVIWSMFVADRYITLH